MDKIHVFRLTKGMDLICEIKKFCERNNIMAGTILSSVGCVYEARIRNAGGTEIKHICENMEIISLNGTVSKDRCHLHVSFSKQDLTVIGGHLVDGCLINTTCEIVLLEFGNYKFDKVFDESTGYNELEIQVRNR